MSDEQPEKQPKKSSIHPSITKKQLEASRKRRKELEEKREVLFTFGDNDQYSVVKAECSCGQEFSYIKLSVEEETTGRFKLRHRSFWHTLCRACLDKFEMQKRLKKFFDEGDYSIVESKCKDCEQCFWYIVRKPLNAGDKLSPNSHYGPRFEKLCQPCSEKFREADYEDDDDDEDDWWNKGK